MDRIRILVADDHPIFLDGFCTVVKARYRELEVVAAVTNGQEAVDADARFVPDVCLLDIRMPVMNGVEAACLIKKHRPQAKIIMLTTYDEPEFISGAFKAGAMGYVLKDKPIAEVVLDIKAVHQGNVLMTSDIADKVGWPFMKPVEQEASSDQQDQPGALRHLTRREREILKLIAQGLTNRQIADTLCISEGTVRNYVSHIYEELGVHHRTAAILWAFEHGLPEDSRGRGPGAG